MWLKLYLWPVAIPFHIVSTTFPVKFLGCTCQIGLTHKISKLWPLKGSPCTYIGDALKWISLTVEKNIHGRSIYLYLIFVTIEYY